MVIIQNVSKIYKFAGTVFLIYIISSRAVTESPITLLKYLPFSQVQVLGF